MTFKEHVIKATEERRKENLEEVRRNINKADVRKKIENHIQRYPGMFDYDEIVAQIMTNDLVASFFAKDPLKQNISESECSKWIGVEKLATGGNGCIRFNSNGEIISRKSAGASKSADFLVEGIYFTQKYTGDNTGGAQDNQYDDVVTFLINGSISHKVGAIVDGDYWDKRGNREKLKTDFADNENVIILSADDIKEGKIIYEN